ncbi:Proton-coupled folate transporter [Frankliniella fusca]|uniref:Proton-coupled folate transporter n=1 Tax=Frankliniella fusca TaxID=407009 RepID=A0AAE1HWC9_9NEOP|nr:Proton-coupled folate transporter [Frankliniella fusca]
MRDGAQEAPAAAEAVTDRDALSTSASAETTSPAKAATAATPEEASQLDTLPRDVPDVPRAKNDSDRTETGEGEILRDEARTANLSAEADREPAPGRDHAPGSGNGHLPEEDALLKKVEPLQVEEKFDFWKLPLGRKVSYIRNNITVEPMLAMYTIPSVLSSLATQNLNLEKACRVNLGYSDEVCDALTRRDTANYTFEESEVQRLTASMAGWKTFIQSSLPAVLILFVGSWSDRHGCRKPCMLLPILGELLTSIGLLVCTYFYYELPIEAATHTNAMGRQFSEAVFPAMTGGWFVMFMAVFTYIADVTSEVDRTFRIGVVNVFFSIGIPIGMALSGVMYRLIGFYGVFSLSSCMYLFSLYYGWTHVKEEPKKWSGDGPQPTGLTGFLKDFFDVRYLLETFHTAFRKGANNRRVRVILLMVVVMLVIGPMHGENTVMYLYVRRKFNWDELDFSIFSTYCVIVNLVGWLG